MLNNSGRKPILRFAPNSAKLKHVVVAAVAGSRGALTIRYRRSAKCPEADGQGAPGRTLNRRKPPFVEKTGGTHRPARYEDHFCYWLGPLLAVSASCIFFAISALRASRLKLAPRCMGGKSKKVCISLPIICWTKTKRQNWYLNQSKYCCAPSFVPSCGQPVRSNGSKRRLVM